MWWRALLLLFFLSLPTPQGLFAQVTTIPVRGGEHDAYTRLVIQIPEDNTWRVTSDGSRAQIIVSGPPVIFDLSQTFARIPRTRLRDLQPVEGGLQLSLACVCEIRASEDIPQFLVIDIFGSAGGVGLAPLSTLRPRPRSIAQQPDTALPGTEARRAGRNLARSLRDVPPDPGPGLALTLAQLFPSRLPDMAPPTVQESENPGGPTPRAAMIEVLTHSLARHVSSGVLESTSAFRGSDEPPDATVPLPGGATAMAHFQMTADRQDTETAQGRDDTCPDPGLIDFIAQHESADAPSMARLLQRLHTEFDIIDPATVVALAQQFLAMGFGAEARMVLSILETPTAASAVLRQISFLLDLSPPEHSDHLAGLATCGKMGVLWAFLAQPEADALTKAGLDLLVQAVGALPAHLRLHLGPVIVKRLVAHRLLDHASMIRDALDRLGQSPTPELTLARTSLDLTTAPADRTAQIEAGLSPENSDATLIFLMERRLTEDEPVEAKLITLAQTRLPALRHSPEGQEVARLLTLAEARNGNFATAFDLLTGREAGFDPPLRAALRTAVLSSLAKDAEDADFVTFVFAQTPWDDQSLPQTTRQALAERLRGLGFEQQAALLEAIDADSLTDADPAQRLDASPDLDLDSNSVLKPDPGTRMADRDDVLQRIFRDSPEDDASVTRARAAVESLSREDDIQPRDAPAGSGGSQAETVLSDLEDRPSMGQPEPETRLSPGAAPLAQGRAALDESAALRARLEAMLSGNDED